ncbi:MAG: VacJ family lipoprotein [Desulfosarcina sp.]|nr:VacJ family lipoprotein [Desulfosarcina sp.]MBC2743501.1 VacJ family lipoprotein [Desulfosarcina sp.]MBC2766411.1 VacJ family lipoprotein [Desulfosarcina sp.]
MSLLAVFLLMVSTVWADPSEPLTAMPPPGEEDTVPYAVVPYDPFDDDGDDIYDDEGELLETVADPISGFNRAMFVFNDKIYFWVLKPVAIGYRAVIPSPVRVSIKNVFYNLLMPVRLVNCLLQGKGKAAEGEFGRFVANTTVGVLGLFNPAKDYPELNPPEEDLGQTLGTYSIGNGFYIVWPVFGPSTLRDTVGSIGDWALNPFQFMQLVNVDAGALTSGTTNVIVYGVRTVNDTSFRIGDYEALKNAALDPYEAFRDAYIQNRNSRIAQ